MNNNIRQEIMPNIWLRAVQTDKFKNGVFSISFLTPLEQETASANSLFANILRRGCEKYPDMKAVAAVLDNLYGASVEVAVRKRGESQCIGFVASVLDDKYARDGETLLAPMVQFLSDLLLHPVTENGVFSDEFTQGEKANLISQVRARLNDKRQYATHRLIEQMCKEERYGVSSMGEEAQISNLTPAMVWAQYKKVIESAPVELYYCGSCTFSQVKDICIQAFSDLASDAREEIPSCDVRIHAHPQPLYFEDALNVTQGKLAMGFRTGGITVWEAEYPALVLCNALFGGSTLSKLFMNVREKLSLCYYASSVLDKMKGIILVSSGIEFKNFETARNEILSQLKAISNGEITKEELEGVRNSVIGSIKSASDSQDRMEDFWLTQAVAQLDDNAEDLIAHLQAVTKDEIAAVARKIELDAVYFLKGDQI